MPSNTTTHPSIGRYVATAILGLVLLIGTTSSPAPEFKIVKQNPNPSVVKNIQVWSDTGGQLGAFRTNGNLALSGAVIANGVTLGGGGMSFATAEGIYVNQAGDTMTGVLILQNGNAATPTGTALLNVRGTMSGSVVYANNSLRSSGSLVVEGTTSGALFRGREFSGAIIRGNAISPAKFGGELFASGSTVATGSGKLYLQVPDDQSGFTIFGVKARVGVAGTTNSTTIQLRDADKNNRKIFGTAITIPTGTTTNDTTFTFNAGNNDVGAGDRLWVDIPAVSTTPPKILTLILYTRRP